MLQQPSLTSQKLLFNRCQAGANFLLNMSWDMLRNKQSSIVVLSHLPPVTAQNSVLQEARLMLMCHQWGLLKTRFIPSVSEHRGNADWLPITYELGNEMNCHKLIKSIKSWLGFHLHLSGSNFTLYYTCWSHIAKLRQNFKLLFGLIYLRLELTQNFWDPEIKVGDWHQKCLFSHSL